MASIPNYTTPPWPSLYNPGLEILHIEYSPPTQPGGKYLYYADDIFRFTLYWTLMFYLPPFLICGFYAFWNYAFPPKRSFHTPDTRTNSIRLESALSHTKTAPQSTTRSKTNKGRSRFTFAVVVFLIFISLSLAGAVIGSAILGFTTFGLFKSADFNMSTFWIPVAQFTVQLDTILACCNAGLDRTLEHLAIYYRDNLIMTSTHASPTLFAIGRLTTPALFESSWSDDSTNSPPL